MLPHTMSDLIMWKYFYLYLNLIYGKFTCFVFKSEICQSSVVQCLPWYWLRDTSLQMYSRALRTPILYTLNLMWAMSLFLDTVNRINIMAFFSLKWWLIDPNWLVEWSLHIFGFISSISYHLPLICLFMFVIF